MCGGREVDLATVARTGEALGERIRAAREGVGLSPAALAEKAGLASPRVGEVEQGGATETSELDAIAQALGLDVHSLLFDGEVSEVLMRTGDATQPATDRAVGILTRFVRDYEFLRSLDG